MLKVIKMTRLVSVNLENLSSLVIVGIMLLSLIPLSTEETSIGVSAEPAEPEMRIGVLMIGFGEPGTFDENTEVAWKNFLLNYMQSGMMMLKMSFMYPMVKNVMIPMIDGGTLLVDQDDPFAKEPKENPILIDAWAKTTDTTGKLYTETNYRWVQIPEGDFPMLGPLFSYYSTKDKNGRGMGESDFWEFVGLEMYGFYQKMNNHNPGGERELEILDETEKRLKEKYGDEAGIVFARGFGAARPGFPDFRAAAEELVKEEGVADLILAEDYIIQSEFEHPAGEIPEYLEKKGLDVNIVTSDQIGGTEPFNKGVAEKVEEELKRIPKDSDVVVILNHHGMFNSNMILYDWREEPYHRYAKETFDGAKKEIGNLDMVKNWTGRFEVWQAYTEFVEEGLLGDPKNEILSVAEAADKALDENFEYCIDVPYEVGNSGFETLIGLREEGWGLETPAWAEYYDYEDGFKKYRTEFNYSNDEHANELKVVITDGWINGTIEGYYEQICKAIDSIKEEGLI
jgi:hypothetical protein